jgi:cytochrome c-type biogenesis protein CcmH/NrfG
MTHKIVFSLAAAAAVLMPATVLARPDQPAATLAAVETRAQLAPRDGGTQIELAQAYARAHRPLEAEHAYRRALALSNEMMDRPGGDSIWSHQVARLALSRTSAVAAR